MINRFNGSTSSTSPQANLNKKHPPLEVGNSSKTTFAAKDQFKFQGSPKENSLAKMTPAERGTYLNSLTPQQKIEYYTKKIKNLQEIKLLYQDQEMEKDIQSLDEKMAVYNRYLAAAKQTDPAATVEPQKPSGKTLEELADAARDRLQAKRREQGFVSIFDKKNKEAKT